MLCSLEMCSQTMRNLQPSEEMLRPFSYVCTTASPSASFTVPLGPWCQDFHFLLRPPDPGRVSEGLEKGSVKGF